MGGVVLGQIVGYLLDHGFSYTPVLAIVGSLHVARIRRHLPRHSAEFTPLDVSTHRHHSMKITEIRTRVVEWRGKTVPLPPHFCTNPMDLLAPSLSPAIDGHVHVPRLADRARSSPTTASSASATPRSRRGSRSR